MVNILSKILLLMLLLLGAFASAQQVPAPVQVKLQLRPMLSSDSSKAIVFVELANPAQNGMVHIRLGTTNQQGNIASLNLNLDGTSSLGPGQHISRLGNRVVVHLGYVANAIIEQTPLYVDARISDSNGSFSAATVEVIQ